MDQILIPGEQSHRKTQQCRSRGISVEEATRKELQRLCRKLRINFALQEVG
ncbi:hypothetical protein SAMN05443144_1148 [Fodinibius roseus]|uniref:Uncharacterized protein n=1 Tax=Fodinibius roseus TaxID=1194090 RepID=A0A1M5EZI9_9BACT|nr:hypothetical protein [Fodinibius roseus]SHF84381.1 hypothetical protein SAMN05443144_1148 [Fodinibius roseus]